MDPNATLTLIDIDRRNRFYRELKQRMQDLREWLDRGGFAPDYSRYPKTAQYLKRHGFNVA